MSSIAEIKNRICQHQFICGNRVGTFCKNKVSLKDVKNNFKYCSLHYKKILDRKLEHQLNDLILEGDERSETERSEEEETERSETERSEENENLKPPELIRQSPIRPITPPPEPISPIKEEVNYKEQYEKLIEKLKTILL